MPFDTDRIVSVVDSAIAHWQKLSQSKNSPISIDFDDVRSFTILTLFEMDEDRRSDEKELEFIRLVYKVVRLKIFNEVRNCTRRRSFIADRKESIIRDAFDSLDSFFRSFNIQSIFEMLKKRFVGKKESIILKVLLESHPGLFLSSNDTLNMSKLSNVTGLSRPTLYKLLNNIRAFMNETFGDKLGNLGDNTYDVCSIVNRLGYCGVDDRRLWAEDCCDNV